MKKPTLAVSLIVAVNALLLNGLKLPVPAGHAGAVVDMALITEMR
jgi:hypothetical protein